MTYFMSPISAIKGGGGGGGGGSEGVGKPTGYLDSPHMLSQYLLIHPEARKAMIKEI